MTQLIILLLSHYLGDYALQTDYMASNKGKDNYVLLSHVATWTFVTSVTAGMLLGYYSLPIILILFIPHLIMDYIKAHNILWCKILSTKESLAIDQLFHLLQLLLVWILFF